MPMFSGQSITVAGAGSGMGRVTAILLAEAGADVTAVDINGDAVSETVGMIEQAGGSAQTVHVDLTQEDQVAAMVDRAVSWRGKLDGAANCAGRSGTHTKILHELTAEEWRSSINVNLTSAFLCLKYQLPALLAAGGGAIVIVSSAGAVETPMFAKTLVNMSEETKSRVAGQHFLGRWGRPREIATVIRWLLSDEASFITGMNIPVDGGSTTG
jgi:2,5-dichloro-2,5-cyclohexadiene-1,4-diol dehydrogenase 1